MASEQRQTALVESYAEQHARLVATLLRLLLNLWAPFPWWNRPDMVNAYAAQSAVYVDIAASRARRLARAYMVQMLNDVDAAPQGLPDVVDTYERGGTPVVEVYKRPARQVEHTIREAKGTIELGPDTIRQTFDERFEQIVEADMLATARDEMQRVMAESPKVIGYRRVIHPELSETGTCGLCMVAADRFYTVDDLLPIHDRCKCTIAPITKDHDPGMRLNREDLDALYKAAGGTAGDLLKRIRVSIHEHGELGPILTRQGDHFRSVDDVNRSNPRVKATPFERMTRERTAEQWASMRETSERSIRILEDAKQMGTNLVDMAGTGRLIPVRDIDEAIRFHRALIARSAAHGAP